MKTTKSGIFAVLGLCSSMAIAQESGPHVGLHAGYLDAGSGNAAAGFNVGYGFNEVLGIDTEFTYKFGDPSGYMASAFLTLSTIGETYIKGKIGGSAGGGDAFDGGSGSFGIGIGHKLANDMIFEIDLNYISSDVQGVNLLIKRPL